MSVDLPTAPQVSPPLNTKQSLQKGQRLYLAIYLEETKIVELLLEKGPNLLEVKDEW